MNKSNRKKSIDTVVGDVIRFLEWKRKRLIEDFNDQFRLTAASESIVSNAFAIFLFVCWDKRWVSSKLIDLKSEIWPHRSILCRWSMLIRPTQWKSFVIEQTSFLKQKKRKSFDSFFKLLDKHFDIDSPNECVLLRIKIRRKNTKF